MAVAGVMNVGVCAAVGMSGHRDAATARQGCYGFAV